jgi:hypothetical protein
MCRLRALVYRNEYAGAVPRKRLCLYSLSQNKNKLIILTKPILPESLGVITATELNTAKGAEM